MATNTRAIKLNNGNGLTYLPITNSNIVQYDNTSLSVTQAIQTLAAGAQNTFINGDNTKATLNVNSVDGSTTNRLYDFIGGTGTNSALTYAEVTVSYASQVKIAVAYKDTNTAKASFTAKNAANTVYAYISPNGSKDSTNGSELQFVQGSNVTLTGDATNNKLTIASTDEKVKASAANTTKIYVIGVNSTNPTNQKNPNYDEGVFLTTTSGDLSAKYFTYSTAQGGYALYVDAAKRIHESSVKDYELGYLSNAKSNIQAQIDNISNSITSGVTFEGTFTAVPSIPTKSGAMYTYTGTGSCTISSSSSITGEDEVLRKGDAIISVYNGTSYVWSPIDNNADIAATNKPGLVTPGANNGLTRGVSVNSSTGAMTVTVDHNGTGTAGKLLQWTTGTAHGNVTNSYGSNTSGNVQLHYVNAGVLTNVSSTVGSGSIPTYVNAGKIQPVTSIAASLYNDTLGKNVLGTAHNSTSDNVSTTTDPYLVHVEKEADGSSWAKVSATRFVGGTNIKVVGATETNNTKVTITGPTLSKTTALSYTTFATEIPDLDATFLSGLGTESSPTTIVTNVSLTAPA